MPPTGPASEVPEEYWGTVRVIHDPTRREASRGSRDVEVEDRDRTRADGTCFDETEGLGVKGVNVLPLLEFPSYTPNLLSVLVLSVTRTTNWVLFTYEPRSTHEPE